MPDVSPTDTPNSPVSPPLIIQVPSVIDVVSTYPAARMLVPNLIWPLFRFRFSLAAEWMYPLEPAISVWVNLSLHEHLGICNLLFCMVGCSDPARLSPRMHLCFTIGPTISSMGGQIPIVWPPHLRYRMTTELLMGSWRYPSCLLLRPNKVTSPPSSASSVCLLYTLPSRSSTCYEKCKLSFHRRVSIPQGFFRFLFS